MPAALRRGFEGVADGSTGTSRLTDLAGRDVQLSEAFFTRGPLCSFSYLYGWGNRPLSVPGSRSQSWLFMPLISLGLLGMEERSGLAPWSVGSRARVGGDQAAFWRREASDVIQAYGEWFVEVHADQRRHSSVAAILSDPSRWGSSRDHLSGPEQEAVTPSKVMGMLTSLMARFAEWSPSNVNEGAALRSYSTPSHRRVQGLPRTKDSIVAGAHALLGPTDEDDETLRRRIADAIKRHPLPAQWKAVTSRSGEVYYWNRQTSVTSWSHPYADVTEELVMAVRDCQSVGMTRLRQDRLNHWARSWHEAACHELSRWRSVAAGDGAAYFYRLPEDGSATEVESTTWEDPRQVQDTRLRFQVDVLAYLLSLPAPDIAGGPSADSAGAVANIQSGQEARTRQGPLRTPTASSQHSSSLSLASRMTERRVPRATSSTSGYSCQRGAQMATRRTRDGRLFSVEPLPTDNSCGFHGLGISREEAARLLLKSRGDQQVMEWVTADLKQLMASLLETGDRERLPQAIGGDAKLWASIVRFFEAQNNVDEGRRKTLVLLRDVASDSAVQEEAARSGRVASALAVSGGQDVLEALQRLLSALKAEVGSMSSGPAKLQLMHRLMECKTEAKSLAALVSANEEADKELLRLCQVHFGDYVEWMGNDSSFWLSFLRNVSGESTGGLLDALAKVLRLTVRVWSEVRMQNGTSSAPPDLELVHEACHGGKEVDLFFQQNRNHYDRLVPCK